MTFPNLIHNNHIQTRINNFPLRGEWQSSPSPESQVSNDEGLILKEIEKNYACDSFDRNELKSLFDFVCKPIQTKTGETFSIIELYAFLITVVPNADIKIISIDLCSPEKDSIFGGYSWTLNNCDEKGCISSTCELRTVIKGDLVVANDLINEFFAWRKYLSNPMTIGHYDLKTAIHNAISFAGQSSSDCITSRKMLTKLIENCSAGNAFAIPSFGPIDHHFILENDIDTTFRLVVPSFEPIKKMIEIIGRLEIPRRAILDMDLIPKITPKQDFVLDLKQALSNLLKLSGSQLDSLADSIKSLIPKGIYDKALIPEGISNKALDDLIINCCDFPNENVKKLGYELLLRYASVNPELWILRNLIKYLPLAIDDKTAMANLESVLKGFPDNMETQKLVSPLKSFCQSFKESSQNGCFEYCMGLVAADQTHTAASLCSRLKLTFDEQMKFIKLLHSMEPLETANLFFKLQDNSKLQNKDEISLFVTIADSIEKNREKASYPSQLLSITACAKKLFGKERMETVLKPAFKPIVQIIKSLVSLNFIPEALDLLLACSSQQITLVNGNQDTEVWVDVCEAGLDHPKIGIKGLYEKWKSRFTLKFSDQKLEVRKNRLDLELKRRLYEKNRDALCRLVLQISGQENNIEINRQIDSCTSDIFKLLQGPELLESALDFLQKMATQGKNPSQLYVDLAIKVTLECANSQLNDISMLSKLAEIVKPYLNAEKNLEKIFKVRKASLKIAEALLSNKLPHEAMNWMQRIIRIAIVDSNTTPESGPQSKPLTLLTLNLPLKPTVLQGLSTLSKQELDILKKLIDYLPVPDSPDSIIRLSSNERFSLINQAKECFRQPHDLIKRLGFELTMFCAGAANDSGKAIIDLRLLHELISYLPLILSAATPDLRCKIIERMQDLLLLSSYADYIREYPAIISEAPNELKLLYQANCKALALTKHLPLCNLGKNLIGKESIEKYSQNFKLKDKVEVALAFITGLLPENVLLALECIKSLGNDLQVTINPTEIKKVYISILNALIDKNYGKEALEQLAHCKNYKILLNKEMETTELWLKWLEKFSDKTFYGPVKGAEHWLSLLKEGALSKDQFPDKQIELLFALIVKLYQLKNEPSDVLANKLNMHLNSFTLSDVQKSNLLEIIETNIKDKLTKETVQTGYHELKSRSGGLLPEEKQLTLKRLCFEASIKYENYALAIGILALIQDQADEEFVTIAFERLLNRLFQFTLDEQIEESRLNLCCRLLTNIDLKKLHGAKFHHASKLLAEMNKNSSACIDEKCNLLKMNLKILENGFSDEGPIIEFVDHLLNFLKAQTIPGDIRNSVISCHQIIAQILQTTEYLDEYRKYFLALHQHHILLKIPDARSQIVWMTSEYLKKLVLDPAILQDIHKLLSTSFPNSSSREKIDTDLTDSLATSLLLEELVEPAKEWIDYTLANDKELKSGPPLMIWCENLIKNDRPLYCLNILEALKAYKYLPPITAELHLSVAKALLEENKEQSIQLLLGNLDLMQKNCLDKIAYIITLIETGNKELLSVAILQLIEMSPKALNDPLQKTRNDWLVLCKKVIKNWFWDFKDAPMEPSELSQVEMLLRYFSVNIHTKPVANFAELEKTLCLFNLKLSFYQDYNSQEICIYFSCMAEEYGKDQKWLETATSCLMDTLINAYIKSDNYLVFFERIKNIYTCARQTDPNIFKTILKQSFKKCLDIKLKDDIERAVIFFQAGLTLYALVEYYANEYSFEKTAEKKYIDQFELVELTELIDRYLFCKPILNFSYIIHPEIGSKQIEEISFPSHESRQSASKIKIVKKEGLDVDDEMFIANGLHLTNEYYFGYFKCLMEYLERWGYFKNISPEIVLMFHLLTGDKFNIVINEKGQVVLNDTTIIDPHSAIEVISYVFDQMVEDRLYHSSDKALHIFKQLCFTLSKNFPDETANLFLKLINDKLLFPHKIPVMTCFFTILSQSNMDQPEWINITSRLFYQLLENINKFTNLKEDLAPSDKHIEYMGFVVKFLINSYEQGHLKSNHPDFLPNFKRFFPRFITLRQAGVAIPIEDFIKVSILLNPNLKTEIFNLICQNFNQLFVLKQEFFFANIKNYCGLIGEGYFESNVHQHETLLKKFVEQFEEYIKIYPQNDIIHYSKILEVLVTRASKLPNKNLSQKLLKSLGRIAEKHSAILIPDTFDPEAMEQNIKLTKLLISLGLKKKISDML